MGREAVAGGHMILFAVTCPSPLHVVLVFRLSYRMQSIRSKDHDPVQHLPNSFPSSFHVLVNQVCN